MVRQLNKPGKLQIAKIKLPKYAARMNGRKIRSRTRCFSLPEQKSVR